nr:WxL domain-containing protein [Streptomyces sp. SID3343]
MAGDFQDDEVSAYGQAGADGSLTIPDLVVSKDSVTAIKVIAGTDESTAVQKPFRVTIPGRDLEQTVTGGVLPGTLTIAQEAAGIKLTDITVNGQAQNMTGALNPVTVKDYRGGATGWTLTGSVSDFTNGNGGKITGDKFTWTPRITNGEGSPSTAVAGSTGPIGTGATLASAPPAATGTGGTFTADADLSLAVPAYQQIGTYSATLTLSIS